MSDEETMAGDTSDTQMLHAEYKDGQLQIVEVTPFERDRMYAAQSESILPDVISEEIDQQKYMQVMDPNKGLVQLDLLNLTLVRCEDGEEYRLVTNSEDGSEIPSDASVTCVLQSSDGEEQENQDYVMVDSDQRLVFLETSPATPAEPAPPAPAPTPQKKSLTPHQMLEKARALQRANDQRLVFLEMPPAPPAEPAPSVPTPSPAPQKKSLTPHQMLKKARALQRAKTPFGTLIDSLDSNPNDTPMKNSLLTLFSPSDRALVSSGMVRPGKRGRRPIGTAALPSPQELLASPNFKLYLYSCKLCTFKCNAVKQLQAHKAEEHGSSAKTYHNKFRSTMARGGSTPFAHQCGRCPFRGATHAQLVKHVQAKHVCQDDPTMVVTFANKISLDSKEVEEADVLVCGACGYESADRNAFREHIETEHGATTT